MKKYIFFFLSVIFLASCEDIIDVTVEDGEDRLVVDAWINDLPQTQVIKLRRTIPYFDNSFSPGVTGATVVVADSDSTLYFFTDEDNDGDYTWTPGPGETLVKTGKEYALFIELDGDEYLSFSTANRSMPIDSITYEFMEEMIGQPEGIYGQVYARDSIGYGDVYWIKTYKNGAFLNKPQEITLVWDSTFGPGDPDTTLSLLIPPLRLAINRVPDIEDDAPDDGDIPPYDIGDSIRVEIHSMTQEAFFFMFQAREQMTNGDNGIFAVPVSNVPTNVFPREEGAKENPVGFFCVSKVESDEIVIQ